MSKLYESDYYAQPGLRGRSWELSIEKQTRNLRRILRENPSFAPLLRDSSFVAEVYGDALLDVIAETGLDDSVFPSKCPYDAAQLIG